MDAVWAGFDKAAGLGSFFKGLGKKTKALVPYTGAAHAGAGGAHAAEKLMGHDEIEAAFKGFAKRKGRQGAMIGGGAGAAVGGAAGGLPTEYHDERGRKKKRSTGQRVAGGLLGAVTMGGAGGLWGHQGGRALAGKKIMNAAAGYDNAVKHVVTKNSKGQWVYSPHAHAKIVDEAGDAIKGMTFHNSRGEQFPGHQVYDKMRTDAHARTNPYHMDMGDLFGGGRGPSNADLRNQFSNRFINEMERNDVQPAAHKMMERLKGEGITNQKQFASKHHPDVNPNSPYKNHFGEIIAAMKGSKNEGAGDAFRDYVKKFKQESQGSISKANAHIKGLK